MSARHQRATEVPLNIHLHARQFQAFTSTANEILYGGAAGGGKSHLMRCAAIIWCAEIKGLQVYLFRREHNDLVKNHMEGPKGFRNLLAAWEQAGLVKIVEDEIRFWNGSKIYLCHCQHEKHRFKYHGAEIHLLLMDELTHFTEVIYRYLRNRVRMVGIDLPEKYKGIFPRILCSSNPGNIGHGWVKASFVDNADDLAIRQMSKSEGGMRRQFIRAKLEDNPSMMEDDPTYEDRLEGLGSEALVRAMRWGDWDVVEGAFFDNFDTKRHVIRPVTLPSEWMRFRAADWGSAKPFSIGWYAVASDPWRHPDGIIVPRGGLVKYREWYGVKENPDGTFTADKGLKLTAEQVADGIIEREQGDTLAYGVMDPAAFSEDGGPSIAERIMNRSHPALSGKVFMRQADNKRVATDGAIGGWDQLRSRLNGDEDGRAMLMFFSTCRHTIRTLPTLQHDANRVEDLMTDSEDHCFTADTLVRTDRGVYSFADLLGTEGKAFSHDGRLHAFRSVRLVRRDQPIVKLTFSDGVEIKCTPDHHFLTTQGWFQACELVGKTTLSLSPQPFKSSTASGTISAAGGITGDRVVFYTGWCGQRPMVRFLRAFMSTIGTGIGTTMPLRISNAFHRVRTNLASMVESMANAASSILSLPRWQPKLGMAALTGWNGTSSNMRGTAQRLCSPKSSSSASSVAESSRTAKPQSFAPTNANRHGVGPLVSTMKHATVQSADRSSSSIDTPRSNPARLHAGPFPVLGSGPVCLSLSEAGRSDVYCFTVPDTGNFALANGMIATQCADETRYACMSRPWTAPLKTSEKDARDDYDDDDTVDEWRIA